VRWAGHAARVEEVVHGKVKERDPSEKPGIDGRMVYRETQRNKVEYFEVAENVSEQRQVTGCCEHDNEPSGFIKCGEFLY
jgi:hypothetical protein